jgi:chromosome partitioning protein
MHVLACYSIKGGVGKTAAAVNLAMAARETDARVLVWDLDPQGAASFYFGADGERRPRAKRLFRRRLELDELIVDTEYDGVDLVPADLSARRLDVVLDGEKHPERRIRKLLAPVADDYDFVFLDCPPSLSNLAQSVFVAATALLVPVIPTPLSLRTLRQLEQFLRDREDGDEAVGASPAILAFLCMVDRRKQLHCELSVSARADHEELLATSIPYSSVVEKMGVRQKPLSAFASGSLPWLAYRGLWTEVAERLSPLPTRVGGAHTTVEP